MRVVAAGSQDESVRAVERVGRRAGKPSVPVRVESVIPRKREGDRTLRVIQLGAAADRRLLVPYEAALDIHVLIREGVLGADQSRELAPLDRESIGRGDLGPCHRQRPKEVTRCLLGIEIRRTESRDRIGADLNVILKEPVDFLEEELAVAQAGQRMLVSGRYVILPQAK